MKLWVLLFFILISGCTQSYRYAQRIDSAPAVLIPDHEPSVIIPRYEPYRLANLRPYKIAGISYQPLLSGYGFVEEGIASWYGQKFHGYATANGETFDMYEYTAAHTTLPLPSYAKVTNLDNGKSLIVRINDRGPFHNNRVIDLSFAAAKELDYLDSGTAKVRIEVIHIDKNNIVTVGKSTPVPLSKFLPPSPLEEPEKHEQYFVQVIAATNRDNIQLIGGALQQIYQTNFKIVSRNNLYRLKLGPFDDYLSASNVLKALQNSDYPEAFIVFE
jgi:rare lipoprotein A